MTSCLLYIYFEKWTWNLLQELFLHFVFNQLTRNKKLPFPVSITTLCYSSSSSCSNSSYCSSCSKGSSSTSSSGGGGDCTIKQPPNIDKNKQDFDYIQKNRKKLKPVFRGNRMILNKKISVYSMLYLQRIQFLNFLKYQRIL